MALFDGLIEDVASRFGLGANARPLVQEALALIFGRNGGMAGFLDLFNRSGLGAVVQSWLGDADAPPLPVSDLDAALGASAIDPIAHRLDIAMPSVSAALAYALPKLVGLVTPHGVVPVAVPPEAAALLGPLAGTIAPHAAHGHDAEVKEIRARRVTPFWLWPAIVIASVIGLAWAVWPLLFPSQTPTAIQTTSAPPVAQAPSVPSTLTVANEGGVAVVSGAVGTEKARAAILDAVKAAFGPDKVKGDVAVEANRSDATWLPNVQGALGALKIPGVKATFEGASLNVGGAVVDADRQKITASLKSLVGGGLTVGAITDAFFGAEASANAGAGTALASLKAGFSGDDLVAALNRIVVRFPYGAADIPASAQPLLGDSAALIKTLPDGQGLEVADYSNDAGDTSANIALSQQRAEAVRNALLEAGVPASRLVARGYGDADTVVTGGAEEQRFQNRRIAFHLIPVPAAASAAVATPAAAPTPAPATPAQPSTLTLDDEPSGVAVSGAVPDDQTRGSILDALKAAFGADAVKGDLSVDPARAAPPWLANLRAALDTLKIPGLKATFEGAAIKLGGAIPDADREQVLASLKSIFGGGVSVASLAPSAGEWAAAANAKAEAALGALKSGYTGADVVAALNLSVVNFATGSAEVPEASLRLLQEAADLLKALPAGYGFEVAGYTDNTGDANGNLVLSRQRAQSVRAALVKAGAPEAILDAKGYGDANPVDSNDTEEGRLRNRRIEYHVTKTP